MSDIAKTSSDFQIGRPLSTYRREPEVETVLHSWNRLSARAVMQRIDAEGARVPNEALVSVAREFVRSGAMADAWTIIDLLTRRVASRTYRHLAVWGIAGTGHHEDVTRDIVHMMIECVLSTEPRNEFWECRFWTCFDRRVRSILRDFSHRRQGEAAWDETVERETPAELGRVAIAEAAVDWTDDIAARALLGRLPEPLRAAFYLKHYAGYSEEGAEPTIASALGVSGRTVRNYLRRAETMLSEWREEGGERR